MAFDPVNLKSRRNILCDANLKKLNEEVNFVTNFGRDIEYYTGIVFEIFAGKKEIAAKPTSPTDGLSLAFSKRNSIFFRKRFMV